MAAAYDEYLKSKHWQSFRLKAILHYGKKCLMCGTKEVPYFHVHHLTYENKGREKLKDVVVLCEICHNEVHRTGFVIKPVVKESVASKRPKRKKKKKHPVSPVATYKLSEEELSKYREM